MLNRQQTRPRGVHRKYVPVRVPLAQKMGGLASPFKEFGLLMGQWEPLVGFSKGSVHRTAVVQRTSWLQSRATGSQAISVEAVGSAKVRSPGWQWGRGEGTSFLERVQRQAWVGGKSKSVGPGLLAGTRGIRMCHFLGLVPSVRQARDSEGQKQDGWP